MRAPSYHHTRGSMLFKVLTSPYVPKDTILVNPVAFVRDTELTLRPTGIDVTWYTPVVLTDLAVTGVSE